MAYWHTKSLTDHNHLGALFGAEQSVAKTLAQDVGHHGTYSTTEKRLAERSGVAPGTVAKAVLKLEHMGVISRHRAGRRSPTVYTWHSCPPGCSDPLHTGKKDTSSSRYIPGAPPIDDQQKPLSKAKRRKQAQEKVVFTRAQRKKEKEAKKKGDLSTSVSTSLGEPSTSLFGPNSVLSTSLGGVLKEEQLNREEVSNDPWRDSANPWLPSHTEAYVLLVQTVEALSKLAEKTGHDPLSAETEVLLDLLNDNSPQALRVAALAVKLWEAIPSPAVVDVNSPSGFTHLHSQQLNEYAAQVAGINTLSLYKAIEHYNATQPSSKPWRTLSQTFKAGFVADFTRKTVAQPVHMSPVGDSVEKIHTGKQFGQLFTPAPVDELMSRLSTIGPE